MGNKSSVTQELVNIYPPWSKVRTDEQSVGYQILNSPGLSLERMEKELLRIRDNQFLTTINLDEIDLVYRAELGPNFTFDEDTTDPLVPTPTAPTMSGLYNGTWYTVTATEKNNIESFWYKSAPNRASVSTVVSGENHLLLSLEAGQAPVTGVWEHHLGGGKIYIEATGGVQYLTAEQERLFRGKVILSGKTRKGTFEEETIIFPWDMKQTSLKEWEFLTDISVFNIESGVNIDIRSADFGGGSYLSPWNFKYSKNRNKIDEFWDIGRSDFIPTLDRIEYLTDEWQQLVLGFSTKGVVESWELLEETNNIVSGVNITVSGVDIAIQPYTDNIWVATADNKLYLYDLNDNMPALLTELADSTHGAHVEIEADFDNVTLGEDIRFVPWHARPIKDVLQYRLWYQQPDGTKYGLLNGSSVSFSSDFWVKIPLGTDLTRTIGNYVNITTTQRGEYLVVLETEFVDGEIQQYRRIFSVKYKTPRVTLDLSGIVPGTMDGIDFDSDQQLWVKSGADYYQIALHKDLVLIDYRNKILYFRENYSSVGVETSG